MRAIKVIFITLFSLLFLVLLAAVTIPYFYKDEIVALVKDEVNDRLNAKIDFNDVNISLFKNFPELTISFDEFSAVGSSEPFQDIPLAKAQAIDLSLDLLSVINSDSGPIKIKNFTFQSPDINVIVLENGTANYDITIPSNDSETADDTSQSSALSIALNSYAIQNGTISYQDKNSNLFLNIKGLNHSGSGDFDESVFDLNTNTKTDETSLTFDGIKYLDQVKIDLDLILNSNANTQKYTIKKNRLVINNLEIQSEGFVALPNDKDVQIDLSFFAPKNSFKNLLSVLPNAYTSDYANVKTEGNFNLDGFVKGIYNQNNIPAFRVRTDVNNASIQYPDLPLPIENLKLKLDVNSPNSDLDNMVVDVPNFNFSINEEYVNCSFNLKSPISDPKIDSKIKGKINLNDWSKAYPMQDVNQLTGIVDADFIAKMTMSAIDNENYESVDFQGAVLLDKIVYIALGTPRVEINHAEAQFSPQYVNIPNFSMKLGQKSDLSGQIRIDNILAFVSPNKVLKGNAKIKSSYIDANELLIEETSQLSSDQVEPINNQEHSSSSSEDFDFTVDMDLKEIVYENYNIKNLKVVGNLTPEVMMLDHGSLLIGDSDITADGQLINIMDYLSKENEILKGQLNLSSKTLNLNQFMTDEEVDTDQASPTASEDFEPILVPENVELKINANVKQVVYTDMLLSNLGGGLIVKDRMVTLDDVSCSLLGGRVEMTGGYGTVDPEKPTFELDYKMKNMDFNKVFNQFNTWSKIAPIGKFLKGNFNTTLSLNGSLKKDMSVDLSSLTLDGVFETLNAVVQGFGPLNKIGNTFNVKELKTFNITNTKNYISIENGKFVLEEFDQKVKDINLKIGGTHSIDSEGMDYLIKAKVPREKLGKINDIAGQGLDFLGTQAKQLGLDIDVGEFLNFAINVTGSAQDPKVNVKLVGTEGKSSNVNDVVTNQIKEEIHNQKQQLEQKAKEEADKLKAEIDAEKKRLEEEAKKKAKEEADKIKAKADAEKKRLEEEAKNKVQDELDKLKDKFNFGNKNNDGGNY